MPPAIVAAGIGAAGAIGGSLLGASSQKSAAKQASNAEVQQAQANNALAEQFRAANQANLQPWLTSGTQANGLLDSFLYGPAPTDYFNPNASAPSQGNAQHAPVAAQTPVPAQQAPQPFTPAHQYGGFVGGLQSMARGPAQTAAAMGTEPAFLPSFGHNALGNGFSGNVGTPSGTPAPTGTVNAPPPQAGGTPTGASPFSGYAAFVNSPYYQFPLQEGMKQLNTGYAANGMLESGDALKGITKYAQNYAYSQGLQPFLQLAGQQSDRGLQAGGAIAGVGLNALNAQTANNTAIGNSQANRAIAGGVANANMYSGIGNALGGLAGAFMPSGGGSSYAPSTYGDLSNGQSSLYGNLWGGG